MHHKTNLGASLVLLTLTFAAMKSRGQFDIEDSHTTASLRGIHNVGGGVAWASGTNGTVLRTEDGGYLWQTCNIPPGAEKLDFRGVQAFDENTAIVMSSGPGDQSRLYKTTDGCQTWNLLFTNPDKEGFWDALLFTTSKTGFLLGDPVPSDDEKKLKFAYFQTLDGGVSWNAFHHGPKAYQAPPAHDDDAVFAASNSSLLVNGIAPSFVTGGSKPSFISGSGPGGIICNCNPKPPADAIYFVTSSLPLASGKSAGGFSVATNQQHRVVVGGDYTKPNQSQGTAAYSSQLAWQPAQNPPHGYRSSVAYDAQQKVWITVGPNGTDISRDDGKNWTALKSSGYDPSDADKNWNALSLPFVVGPHGRIGRLRTIDAETQPTRPVN